MSPRDAPFPGKPTSPYQPSPPTPLPKSHDSHGNHTVVRHPPASDSSSIHGAAPDLGSPLPKHEVDDGPPTPSRRGRFVRAPPESAADDSRSPSPSPFSLPMPFITPGQLAFSALQFLPVPVLVLNGLKTVVLANEAMGRLLGMVPAGQQQADHAEDGAASGYMDKLRGQTLSQVGIDMLQDGRPVWVSWEKFLDSFALEMGAGDTKEEIPRSTSRTLDEASPTPTPPSTAGGRPPPQAVVEVVVSCRDLNKTTFDARFRSKTSEFQVTAKMIISIWEVDEHQTYFTLTFTNSETASSSIAAAHSRRSIARPKILDAAERKTISISSPSSMSSGHNSSSPSHHLSPGSVSLSSSPFPPMGPPSRALMSSTPSILRKITTIKDALLDNTMTPILGMWKDGSVTFPNAAARNLLAEGADFDNVADGFDLLHKWTIYTEDFKSVIDPNDHPISVLLRTEQPFTGFRIGMKDRKGKEHVFDCLGEAIRDDTTGEFLAGVVTCRDVTKMTRMITQIKEDDEERFRLICDTMPQLVWTTTPDGDHDFFNNRWYTYTGLSKEEALGRGWTHPFHPDDLPETLRRWNRSLQTGESYVAEYRYRSKEGEWRWFLGRAIPLVSKETGEIEKWFGTCIDVHESIETKLAAKRTREQLLGVIAHAHVTIFTVNRRREITMMEGALIWDAEGEDHEGGAPWYIGEKVDRVFNRLNPTLKEGERPQFLESIDDIIEGRSSEDIQEHGIDGRWYRTRFLPIVGKGDGAGSGGDVSVEGVIGVVMDVTELKAKESDLEVQGKEKRQLMANEAAAKEASRLKSQFLANMSHEIRTPITGVIGMAELLLDLDLGEEQREYTENIYRSANALLTVINDILDFSKVESGRLDIEEVQFSLSIIVGDVNKMLSFAAERKNLDFRPDISPDIENDLVVLGDPGRVRQIVTNLLTNSIKFTHQGYVKFSVLKERETADTIEIKFVVEDTGIGMEEEVLQRLFQPFSQGDASTARKFGGTGLGLTICKNLLDLMHGHIELRSALGVGTTATFWISFHRAPHGAASRAANLVQIDALPDRLQSEMSVSCNSSELDQGPLGLLAAEMLPQSLMDETRSSGSVRRNKRVSMTPPGGLEEDLPLEERAKIHVLVVEDNPINQQIATQTIKKLGFSVSAAWNGKAALEYLAAAQSGSGTPGAPRKPDLVLMDVQMPVIDGYKCTHVLRHHAPYKAFMRAVPIVAMTASAIQGDREKCRRAGMDDYLAKPVRAKTLERMLVRWGRAAAGTGTGMRPEAEPRVATPPPHGHGHGGRSGSSAGASVCSSDAPGDECDVPGVPFESPRPPDATPQVFDDLDGQADRPANPPAGDGSSPITPRPPAGAGAEAYFPAQSSAAGDFSPAAAAHYRREVAEVALQSRYEKLLMLGTGAGGSRAGLVVTGRAASGGSSGGGGGAGRREEEALTEENVERLEMEERRRRG